MTVIENKTQHSSLIRSGIEAGLIGFIISLFRDVIMYITRWSWMYSGWAGIVLLVIVFTIFIYYPQQTLPGLKKINFGRIAAYALTAIFTFIILNTLFVIFLHEIIDNNYKQDIADIQLKRTSEYIEEIEKKHNVVVDGNNYKEREMILKHYSFSGIIKAIPFSLITGLFSGLIITFVLKFLLYFKEE